MANVESFPVHQESVQVIAIPAITWTGSQVPNLFGNEFSNVFNLSTVLFSAAQGAGLVMRRPLFAV